MFVSLWLYRNVEKEWSPVSGGLESTNISLEDGGIVSVVMDSMLTVYVNDSREFKEKILCYSQS